MRAIKGFREGSQVKQLSPHGLRALYCSFVFALFRCPDTFNYTIQRCLGHADLSTSLAYNFIRVDLEHAFG